MELIIAVFALVAAVALYIMFTYNAFVGLRVRINEAWSDIEVQMKRRYNLIPNLVETVKGYASHEAGTLENVTRARGEALANQGTPAEQAQSENMLTGALKSLFALSENYPDLKANDGFLQLQHDLSLVEEKIQAARRYYNGTVRNNNTKVARFPSNLVAGQFKFEAAEFFELDEDEDAARRPVAVDLG
ncbi:MAG: LemA family protein [Alphaproteobacteria bacterium]|nr:LemA family protein [Alphaproteobacteria bacterium]MCZ6812642.1 LemA family protein [Alphaproteobacteria bacterium]